jgi:ketosteroid isomerase-like protein
MDKGKKFALVLIALVFVTSGCQQQSENSKKEEKKLKAMIHELFEVIDRHDYQALRDICTEDFVLFEVGKIMDIDQTIEFIRPFRGKGEVTRTFENIQVYVDGTAAWIHLKHKAVRAGDGHERSINWFESAGLRKVEGMWKFALYHNSVIGLNEQ